MLRGSCRGWGVRERDGERWEGCNDGRDGKYGRGTTSDSFGLYNGGVLEAGVIMGMALGALWLYRVSL